MLSDSALAEIAQNLQALKLDPVAYLRVAVAVVGPLMRNHANGVDHEPPELEPHEDLRRRSANPEPAKQRALARRAKTHKRRHSIAIAYNGREFPSRDALAKHLVPLVKRTPTTVAHALRTHHDDPEAVVRLYQPQPHKPTTAPPLPADPDARALAYLRAKLGGGPVEAAQIDAEVEKGRLFSRSVDKAKSELGLVAVRRNGGKGRTVHYCLPDQAARLETAGA